MELNEIVQLQANAYLKGSIDILRSFEEAAEVILKVPDVPHDLVLFLSDFTTTMRKTQAALVNKFEEMGVDVSGTLDW